MSTSISFPKQRLARLLRMPGGKSVAAALQDADAALAALDEGLAEIARLLPLTRSLADGEAREARTRIYHEANAMVGVAHVAGLPHLDRAAYGLCELADGLMAQGRWDADAVAVHVQALHLLRQAQFGDAMTVLDGLEKVRVKTLAADAAGL